MKALFKRALRRAAAGAPWGARFAMLEGCLDGMDRADVAARVLPRLGFAEVVASGDRGMISSRATDNMVIQEYARTGTFAPQLTEAIQTFFLEHGGGTYVDVGANIGLMTIPFAGDPRVHCIAFEPDPTNFDLLQRNIARNVGSGAVQVHQLALFDKEASLTLALADDNLGDHRLTLGDISGRRTIEVKAVPLDDFLPQVQRPLVVKIDTQGAEPFVIAGGRSVLSRTDFLVMEFCPYLLRQLGGDPDMVISLVSRFSSVALMGGGPGAGLHYMDGKEAGRLLHDKLRTAKDTDGDFLDILARRL